MTLARTRRNLYEKKEIRFQARDTKNNEINPEIGWYLLYTNGKFLFFGGVTKNNEVNTEIV
jgi:hypothetical protein